MTAKAAENKTENKNDAMLVRLLNLLALQKSSRHKRTKIDLLFLILNQTFSLVPYRHSIYWEIFEDRVSIKEASGQIHLEKEGPYSQWLKEVIHDLLFKQKIIGEGGDKKDNSHCRIYPLTPDSVKPAHQEKWMEWAAAQVVLIPFYDPDKNIFCGLWIDRPEPFSNADLAILEDLCDSYAYTLHAFQQRNYHSWISKIYDKRKSHGLKFALALIVIMLFPVRLSVTVPAEIAAESPEVVTIPFEGIIKDVKVKPNQQVAKGDVLIALDDTALTSRLNLARQELEMTQIKLQKTEREAFEDPTKRSEVNILREQIKLKELESAYAENLLKLSTITAPTDGIVMFSDINNLMGKPVHTGDQVMMVSDPTKSELLVRVPVNAMIDIDRTVPVKFFLNTSPLSSDRAQINTISYQATHDQDRLMTYKIRASFINKDTSHRIGLTGTAKVYGDHTILIFNILKRPLVTLRRFIGI